MLCFCIYTTASCCCLKKRWKPQERTRSTWPLEIALFAKLQDKPLVSCLLLFAYWSAVCLTYFFLPQIGFRNLCILMVEEKHLSLWICIYEIVIHLLSILLRFLSGCPHIIRSVYLDLLSRLTYLHYLTVPKSMVLWFLYNFVSVSSSSFVKSLVFLFRDW